jgi:pimeloyl-ACP methyl ester carboxylesterase
MWHPQANKVSQAGFRLITPDLRGFGDSEVTVGPYSMELFADDIVELLDHLGVEKAVVGGMSMGGYVLLNLLERYPDRLSGACFIVTRATADDEAGKVRRLQLAQDVMKFGPQIVADAFKNLLFAEQSLTERPKLVGEIYRWMTDTDSRGLTGGLLAMRERKDYSQSLSSINLPALAIGAALDKAAPPENTRAIAAGIPGCRLAIIPDAGHMANLEHPGAFNSCLLDFLEMFSTKPADSPHCC